MSEYVRFEVRVAGKVRLSTDQRERALLSARAHRNAEVWCVTTFGRKIEGSDMILPEKDRARNASSHLKGTRSKFVSMRAYDRAVEARIY